MDTAVQKINEIPDIETEVGKKKLTRILEDLKRRQQINKENVEYLMKEKAQREETKIKDEENVKEIKPVEIKKIFYLLPWELPPNCSPLRHDQCTQITKEVYAIAADENALLASKSEHVYEFEFDMDSYVILA